jgi:pyruvate formate lyase activating enzyme
VKVCETGARELMGRLMSADEVMAEILKDRIFYRRSGGGVTFSGGEALVQPKFLRNLAERCRDSGINTALETSGFFPWDECRETIAMMDLVFLDIKHMDTAAHKRLTGVENRIILENAVNIANEKIPLVIRFPLIPSVNDDPENIAATAAFVGKELDGVRGVEVLPYHVLGRGKHKALGLPYGLEDIVPPGEADAERAKLVFSTLGITVLAF